MCSDAGEVIFFPISMAKYFRMFRASLPHQACQNHVVHAVYHGRMHGYLAAKPPGVV